MSGSEWAPLATLAGAALAALTAAILAGVLTARGRLERRLEKLAAICDKLPVGAVRSDLEQLTAQVCAELLVRSDPEVKQTALIKAHVVAICGSVGTFLVFAPQVGGWWYVGGYFLTLVAIWVGTGWRLKLEEMTEKRLTAARVAAGAATSSPPTENPLAPVEAAGAQPQDAVPEDQAPRLAS